MKIYAEVKQPIKIYAEVKQPIKISTEIIDDLVTSILIDNSGSMVVTFSKDEQYTKADIVGVWKDTPTGTTTTGVILFDVVYDSTTGDMCSYIQNNNINENALLVYDSADDDNKCDVREPFFDITSNNAGTYILEIDKLIPFEKGQ